MSIHDGLQNVISGLGRGGDKSTYNRYGYQHTVTSAQVDAAYRTSGLARKVHALIPEEGTRAGRDWQTDKAIITKLVTEEKRLQVWPKLRDLWLKARLYGGAALVVGVDRGAPSEPIEPGAPIRFLTVLTREQLTVTDIIRDPYNPYFGEPEYYMMRDGTLIDPSRVIAMIGQPVPNTDLSQFWGDPLLMSLWTSLTSSDVVHQTIASLLPELKADTLAIPNLSRQLSTAEYEAQLMKRVQMAGLFQSMFNIKLIDAGDGTDGGGETWETRQLALSGMPELMNAMIARVAAETDIPVTRLSGISPGGMQSTGKGEQTDFEKSINSKQELELRPIIDRLDVLLIPSALGSRAPADPPYWTFAPLSQLSEAERADVQLKRAQAFVARVNTGAINADALATAEVNSMIESGDYPGLEEAIEANGIAPEVDTTVVVPPEETTPPVVPDV